MKELLSLFDYIREDLKRYFLKSNGFFERTKIVLLTQGIWAILIYRAGSYLYKRKSSYPFPSLLLHFLTLIQKFVEIVTGIVLPFTAEIGKGLYIGHFGSIIVSHMAVIGEYCNISQENTIGQAGRGGKQYAPVIGNRVYIAPGAKVFGKIRIGNDVAIGANAVVSKDIPDNAVVGGNPSKIISYDGSADFVLFESSDNNVPENRE